MDKQKRQDIIIKICCLVAAIVLWMYVRSSEDPVITSVLKYVPVEVLNADTLADKGLVLIEPQDFYINLSVKAAASVVSDLDKNKDFKLVVDLQGYGLIPGENKVPVQIKESPTGVTISNADALNMKIDVDSLVEKNVDVTATTVGKVSSGYYSGEPVVNPNTVRIVGPQRIVDQIVSGQVEVDLTDASQNITKNLKVKLINEEGKEINGVSLAQEYVQVNVAVTKGKTLNVNVRTVGTAPQNIFIESITSVPASIEVAGESSIVDGLSYINTGEIDLSKITESTTLDVPLVIPENVKVVNNQEYVQVKVVVTKYQEKKFTVPINYVNLGDMLTLEQHNPTVEIIVNGSEEAINALTVDIFKATVNLSNLAEGSHELEIELTGIPENIQLKSTTPSKVTVVIKKTNEETGNNDNQG